MKTRDNVALQERPALVAASATSTRSAIGTILFHIHDDVGLDSRLEAALSLARVASAHLECLHVTPIQAYTVTDAFGGVFTSGELLRTLEEEATKLRAGLERKLAAEDVSWSYREITGEGTGQVVAHAALADLLVAGRGEQAFGGSSIGFLGDLLSDSRTPLLILSDSPQAFDPEGPALVGWNGSYEAGNAVRASVGLLQLASEVHVIQFEDEKPGYFPSTRPLEYLSRHGIHAELRAEPRGNGGIAEKLVSYAVENGMSYIVMGGYSHSRAGEFIFGGVTRELLKQCPVPLVMAR
jgi:nucleotide-binding universal stress UspA family protein